MWNTRSSIAAGGILPWCATTEKKKKNITEEKKQQL